jgi:hypothetical protein
MQTYIGWWARRHGRWHLVESEVTDRLVMRCGRQMKLETPYGYLVFELEPADGHCKQCGERPS